MENRLPKHREITESRFNQVKLLLDIAINDKNIQSKLNEYGYNSEKLREGISLFNETLKLYNKNIISQNLENPDDFQHLWNEANDCYSQLVHISRIALQYDRNAFIQLGLAGPRKKSLSGWLSQANQFYINALSNPEIIHKLEEFGITKEKIEKGKKQLDLVEISIVSRKNTNCDTLKLTLEYDKALDNMEGWLAKFSIVSRIAFEKMPQLLSKMQINHR